MLRARSILIGGTGVSTRPLRRLVPARWDTRPMIGLPALIQRRWECPEFMTVPAEAEGHDLDGRLVVLAVDRFDRRLLCQLAHDDGDCVSSRSFGAPNLSKGWPASLTIGG
jgi:hypothetical protein